MICQLSDPLIVVHTPYVSPGLVEAPTDQAQLIHPCATEAILVWALRRSVHFEATKKFKTRRRLSRNAIAMVNVH